MSEIKVILVLSFLMHIHRCYVYMYTMLLFLHFSKDVVHVTVHVLSVQEK